jgi:hypothetical protein
MNEQDRPPINQLYASATWLLGRHSRLNVLAQPLPGAVVVDDGGAVYGPPGPAGLPLLGCGNGLGGAEQLLGVARPAVLNESSSGHADRPVQGVRGRTALRGDHVCLPLLA